MKTANSLLSRIFPSLANSAARATKAKAPRATALRIEPLEARELLDAAPIVSPATPDYPTELIFGVGDRSRRQRADSSLNVRL